MRQRINFRKAAVVSLIVAGVAGATLAQHSDNQIRVILTDRAAKPVATFSQVSSLRLVMKTSAPWLAKALTI